MLWRLYFTGIVDDDTIPQEVLDQREQNWGDLGEEAEQKKFLDDVRARSKERRSSMFETANRSNFLLVALAFAVSADVALLIVESSQASLVALTASFTLIVFSTCILLLAISARAKVLKAPRAGGESEPDEMLQWAAERKRQSASNQNVDIEDRRDREMIKLYKRKLTLVVDRRAQWVAAVVAVVGLLLMVVGLWLRLF